MIEFDSHLNIIPKKTTRVVDGKSFTFDDYRTALTHSAAIGDIDGCRWLIEHGADVDETDELGETALLSAVGHEDIGMCKLLIDHGADINKETRLYESVFGLAVYRGNIEICKLLLEHGANTGKARCFIHDTPLSILAVQSGIPEACDWLFRETNAEVNAADDEGWTALMEASRDGNADMCKILIK